MGEHSVMATKENIQNIKAKLALGRHYDILLPNRKDIYPFVEANSDLCLHTQQYLTFFLIVCHQGCHIHTCSHAHIYGQKGAISVYLGSFATQLQSHQSNFRMVVRLVLNFVCPWSILMVFLALNSRQSSEVFH